MADQPARVRRRRQAAEHRLARLAQLGLRQARFVGRAKTLFQLAMAATVANLTLLAGQGLAHPPSQGAVSDSAAPAVMLTAAVLVLLLAHALTDRRAWSWRRHAVRHFPARLLGLVYLGSLRWANVDMSN